MRKLIETRWEKVPCDVCDAMPPDHTILGTRNGRLMQKKYDYLWCHSDVQCRRCGFVFNQLRPDAKFLHQYYADCWQISSSSVPIAPDFDVEKRLDLLQRWLMSGARIYEIGDKMGEFHATLSSAGYNIAGDDVMSEEIDRCEWLGSLFRRGHVSIPPAMMRESFDAVLAYFVVEHLANPQDWLMSIRRLLKPEGRLVVEVPHLLYHPKEVLMHEHFLYLTPEALTALICSAGYTVLEIRPNDASRAFGFSLVAQRIEESAPPNLRRLLAQSAAAKEAYLHGREILAGAKENLLQSARLVIAAVEKVPMPSRIFFLGANQTSTEIQAHLSPILAGADIPQLAMDNSDAKNGTYLKGFTRPVEKPVAESFSPNYFNICVICTRGWTADVAQQIRDFRPAHFVLIDGAAGQLLPMH